ncbi:hypothetical protein AB0H71_31755 [Nocardia sp. NPDC050697]|uniref:hypothetical protein n=1 Tax=Nocardia sp. NPDC050697 TaxID=3155158 RepID=UPI0034018DF7
MFDKTSRRSSGDRDRDIETRPPTAVAPPVPDSSAPPSVSWPSAFLASVIVIGGLSYHYLSVERGVDPVQALRYLLVIAVPLVVLVLPASSAGAAVRALCRFLGVILASAGGTR